MLNARDQHTPSASNCHSARLTQACTYLPTTSGLQAAPSHGQAIRNINSTTVARMIREIEIWRGAVLMVNRYADEAEANSFQRAEELRRSRLFGQLPGKNKLKAGSRLLG